MMKYIDSVSLPILIVLCLTLGMAPFSPQPHLVEKSIMLMNGELHKPVDIFDLVLHGAPWLLLLIKLVRMSTRKQDQDEVDNA